MPKQTRWRIKRQVDNALRNIDRAQEWLIVTGKEYEGIHDDYAEAFSAMAKGLETVRLEIIKLRDRI